MAAGAGGAELALEIDEETAGLTEDEAGSWAEDKAGGLTEEVDRADELGTTTVDDRTEDELGRTELRAAAYVVGRTEEFTRAEVDRAVEVVAREERAELDLEVELVTGFEPDDLVC